MARKKPPIRNPFVFGRVVSGETFCNRQQELQELRRAARSGRSLWIHSPRRFGKTSLILEAFAETKIPFAYVDVYAALDEASLAEAYLRGISSLLTVVLGPGEKVLRWMREVSTHIAPLISFDPHGKVELTLSPHAGGYRPVQLDEIVDLPQRLAASHGIGVTVAIDEFQEITRFAGIEGRLRSLIQHHDRVAYMFCGSRRGLLADLFSNRDRPFFQFAEHYPLQPIATGELTRFVRGRFASTGLQVPAELARAIVGRAHGHPNYTQMVASRVWDMAQQSGFSPDLVDRALGHLARSQDLPNRRWLESQPPSVRRVALHIAHHGGERMLSQEVRLRSRLGPPSTVQKALAKLTEREELVRDDGGSYRFVDPMLAHWLTTVR